MEVHRQTCQACGSRTLNNLLRRTEGEAQTVFVRCASCGELVAVYRLRDYYHHGKGFASWVSTRRHTESARSLRDLYDKAKSDALIGFREVLDALTEAGKQL